MANSTKITEIIDEKAFADWERFLDSLEKGQKDMAKMVQETSGLTKAISGSGSIKEMKSLSDELAKSMSELEKVRAKQAKTEQQLVDAQAKLIESSKKKALADESEKKRIKELADSYFDVSKASATLSKSQGQAVMRSAELKKEIADLNKAFKTTKDSLSPEQVALYEKNLALLKEEYRQSNVEVKQFARETLSAETSMDRMATTLASLRTQYAKLTDEQRKNADVGGVLLADIQKLDAEYKELRESQGVYTDSVGNYSRIWDRLPEPMRRVVETLHELGTAQIAQGNSIKRVTGFQTQQQRQNEKSAGITSRLVTATDKATVAQDENNQSTRESVGFKIIANNANKDLAKSTDSVADSLEDIGAAEKQVTFKTMIAGLKALAMQAAAFIATPIGITLAALAGIAAGAKAWFDYNKELAVTTKLTKQLTDLTGDALKSVRSEVQVTADTFDKDFAETLRAVNALSKEFGISFSEANDIIQKGFIKGADASGQFLDNIREYAVQMKAAGLTAEETIAVMTRQEKEGIFSDKGIDTIKEGTLRIREMTKTTRDALTGIGLDADAIQKKLLSGQMTTFDVLQQVSKAMEKFSDNSQEVGTVLADVFAGPGEDAGLRFIRILQDINAEQELNLENFSETQKATIRQIQVSEELKKETAALFDVTGGGFEIWIANAKIMATEWLIALIKGTRELVNWFIELYNESVLYRGTIAGIVLVFQTLGNVATFVLGGLMDSIKNVGNALKGLTTLDFKLMKDSFAKFGSDLEKRFLDVGEKGATNFADAVDKTLNGRISKINPLEALTGTSSTSNTAGVGTVGDKDAAKRAADKAAKDAEKDAKDRLKIESDLEKRLLELSKARLEREKRTYDILADYSMKVVDDERNAFEDRMSNLIDFADNQKKALDIEAEISRLAILERLKEAEELEKQAREAKKEGRKQEDEDLIANAKALREIALLEEQKLADEIAKKKEEINEKTRQKTIQLLQKEYNDVKDWTLIFMEENFEAEQRKLAEQRRSGEITEKQYLESRKKLLRDYNKEVLQEQISSLETLIEAMRSNGEAAYDLEKQLAKLRIELSKSTTEEIIEDTEKLEEAQKKAKDRLKELAKETATAIGDLFRTLNDNRIQEIDAQIKLSEENEAKEVERINNSTLLEEEKAARILAIETKSAQEQERLRRQRVQAEQRQARFDKMSALFEIGIMTAKGIMGAVAASPLTLGMPWAALIGGLGLIQAGAVIAKKLPTYYTGTNNSKEGFAHVGERGTELGINPDGTMFLTPPTDTITYLQKGTKILNAQDTKKVLSEQNNFDSMHLFDFNQLVSEQKKSTAELKKAFKDNASKTFITKHGLKNIHSRNARLSDYHKRNWL